LQDYTDQTRVTPIFDLLLNLKADAPPRRLGEQLIQNLVRNRREVNIFTPQIMARHSGKKQ
jgi:hypothetical protein